MQCGTGNVTKLPLKRVGAPVKNGGNMLSEAFPATAADAGAVGFILSELRRISGAILWIQDRQSQMESGHPYLPALTGRSMIQVDLNRPVDVLWAAEEGLRCQSLGAIVAELWGDPHALTFTATKRLALRAERYKVPCWLIRRGASPDLSAARNRWRIASLPSHPHIHDSQAPGDPRWQVELFRSRTQAPGTWVASYDRAADNINFSAPFRDGTLVQDDGTERRKTV